MGLPRTADDGGKALIQQVVRFTEDPELRDRMIFLPDYDISMARHIYAGCDVWLNNPVRPLEACGTSGMKSALNGGLNLSILDGWWDEMADGENGWAIGSAEGVTDEHRRDDLEAQALYELLEESVIPLFYGRDDDGVTVRLVGPQGQARVLRASLLVAANFSRSLVSLFTPAYFGRIDPGPGRRRRWLVGFTLLLAGLFAAIVTFPERSRPLPTDHP